MSEPRDEVPLFARFTERIFALFSRKRESRSPPLIEFKDRVSTRLLRKVFLIFASREQKMGFFYAKRALRFCYESKFFDARNFFEVSLSFDNVPRTRAYTLYALALLYAREGYMLSAIYYGARAKHLSPRVNDLFYTAGVTNKSEGKLILNPTLDPASFKNLLYFYERATLAHHKYFYYDRVNYPLDKLYDDKFKGNGFNENWFKDDGFTDDWLDDPP